MPKRYLLLLLAVVLIAAVGLAAARMQWGGMGRSDSAKAATSAFKTFSLIDHTGQPVNETSYRGRWMLVFFGFTRCPDVCPTSMIYAGDLLKTLGPAADKMQIVFVTVDPERDTAPALMDYLTNFDSRIVGLTGTAEQIAGVTKAFGVYYAKRPLEGQDDYAMDHSSAFYLVNPHGRFQRAFSLQRGADQMTADIRDAMGVAAAKE